MTPKCILLLPNWISVVQCIMTFRWSKERCILKQILRCAKNPRRKKLRCRNDYFSQKIKTHFLHRECKIRVCIDYFTQIWVGSCLWCPIRRRLLLTNSWCADNRTLKKREKWIRETCLCRSWGVDDFLFIMGSIFKVCFFSDNGNRVSYAKDASRTIVSLRAN